MRRQVHARMYREGEVIDQQDMEDLIVVIGTSNMVEDDPLLAGRITQMVNAAYGYGRVSEGEIRNRMSMGSSFRPNRVLHLAWRGDVVVGCCSSTIQPPWTCCGCGHWGFLSVHPDVQGAGIASALVLAAEQRLAQAGCIAVQIEYQYCTGDELSERLRLWYEGKLGFKCASGAPSTVPGHHHFRICHKCICPTGCSCCHQCLCTIL